MSGNTPLFVAGSAALLRSIIPYAYGVFFSDASLHWALGKTMFDGGPYNKMRRVSRVLCCDLSKRLCLQIMKRLLLLLGALACAQASDFNITNSQDALSYVLNLKCIRKRPSWPCSVQFVPLWSHKHGLRCSCTACCWAA